MPIHDQGYRRYAGSRVPRSLAWWVIARAGIVERLRDRRFLALLLFAWLPFLVRGVQIYIASSFPQASFLALDERTFRAFIDQQRPFVFFATIYAGAGLIANDRQANALQLYFSKPITRAQYVCGKLLILVVFLAAVTWLPAVSLLFLQTLLSGSLDFFSSHLFLLPAITIGSALEIGVAAVTMLALSSLSRSSRFVAILYAGITLFAAAFGRAVGAATGIRGWTWLSPQDTLTVVIDATFGVPTTASGTSVAAALLVVALLVGASIVVLARQVRAVEVV